MKEVEYTSFISSRPGGSLMSSMSIMCKKKRPHGILPSYIPSSDSHSHAWDQSESWSPWTAEVGNGLNILATISVIVISRVVQGW